MARKRHLFFHHLQSLLRFRHAVWLLYLLLALAGLILASQSPMVGGQPPKAHHQALQQTASTSLASDPVDQGKQLYEAGRYTDAITQLQQGLEHYQQQGDQLRQAMVLSNLSLTYQQLGNWSEATQAVTQALKLMQTVPSSRFSSDQAQVIAQSFDIEGRLLLAIGKPEDALDNWSKSLAIYTQLKDSTGILRSQINQARAFQALGMQQRALTTLTQQQTTIKTQPDSTVKAVGLRSLGEVLQFIGETESAQAMLKQSLDVAQRIGSSTDIGAALLSLGNQARFREQLPEALNYYRQAATSKATSRLPAQLNQLSTLIQLNETSEAQSLWPQIQTQVAQLPLSRSGIYAQINLAQSLMQLNHSRDQDQHNNSSTLPPTPSLLAAQTILEEAITHAQTLSDIRAQAEALGSLGEWYALNEQPTKAQSLLQQAILQSQSLNAPEISYRLQWRLGHLLKQQGNSIDAIAAYRVAVQELQNLRTDLTTVDNTIQFSFRNSVEPVYREYVDLLLTEKKPNQESLKAARETIDALQTAEIANFLQVSCLDTNKVAIDAVTDKEDPTAAFIYSILLPDRMAVILKLPRRSELQYFSTTSEQPQEFKDQFETRVKRLRQALRQRTSQEVPVNAQWLYDKLIRPGESMIAHSGAKTLVFVLDGNLRNIPIAALHDGKQFLIEQPYNIALLPGLQLFEPQRLQQRKLRVIAAGLSKSPLPEFSPLDSVATELKEIQAEVPSVELLNQAFTRPALIAKVSTLPFPVIHLATHGEFSSKVDETFILAWDGRIKLKQLDTMLKTSNLRRTVPIELLVLSACETVVGDQQAALGLAGVAVRAGARSTLATLWQVDDQATASLIGQFYQELAKPNVSKAEALGKAQRFLAEKPEYQHPYYWAPFVLVGNWM